MFVKEARRDDGQLYTPRSLMQLLSGIQHFSSSKVYTTPESAYIHCKKAFVILTIAFVQLLTRNSPLWQPAVAIQHTWSTGTAGVATRTGKFA